MNRIALAAMLAVCVNGEAEAYDSHGLATTKNPITCTEYLDAYSKTTLTGETLGKGPAKSLEALSWIDGFISAYNHTANNGKQDITAGMTFNDSYKWIASWCRDNLSSYLDEAALALIDSRK